MMHEGYTQVTPGLHPVYIRVTRGVHPGYARGTPELHPSLNLFTPGYAGPTQIKRSAPFNSHHILCTVGLR